MRRNYLVAAAVLAMVSIAGSAHATDWNGFYAGVHGSYTPPEDDFFELGSAGLSAGVQAGYNMQMGPALIGVELEGDKTFSTALTEQGHDLDQQWQVAAKARAGLALGGTLVYGTAGYGAIFLGDNSDVEEGWQSGLLVGAGVEQKLTDQLSVRVSYEQLQLDDLKLNTSPTTTIDTTFRSVKAGVNFAF